MPVVFDSLLIGEQYERPELAELWGYRDWHAIGRGIVAPASKSTIVLFVTKEQQKALTQYQDHFEGDRLFMEGETSHSHDARLVGAAYAGDTVHLFYREWHHAPFTYFGEVRLVDYELREDTPSKFVFDTLRSEAIAASARRTEDSTHGNSEGFVGDEEGRKHFTWHVTYERSSRNRAEAIRVHGTACKCCGFDFNAFYGPLANDYIEVHHVKSITETDGVVDPRTDLAPLCSNCHSVVHRRRGESIPVDALRDMLRKRGSI